MKKIKILILLLATIGIAACGNTGKEQASMQGSEAASHESLHSHDHGSHGGASDHGLVLDNGRKWPLDESTRAILLTMRSRLNEKGQELAEGPGRLALGNVLQEDLSQLIRGCTMTGPAHDQLHVFLNSLLPAVDKLKREGDTASLARVRDLLQAAGEHFE